MGDNRTEGTAGPTEIRMMEADTHGGTPAVFEVVAQKLDAMQRRIDELETALAKVDEKATMAMIF